MDRREFVVASAIVPMLSTQAVFAECRRKELSGTPYDDLLQSVRRIAKGEQITMEEIKLAITALANIDTKAAVNGAAIKLIKIAGKDEELLREVDRFVTDFNGPEAALNILLTQPEIFLDRPSVTNLSNRLTRIVRRDATLFLLAANNLGTNDYLKYLPQNVPITRDPDEMAREAEAKECPLKNVLAHIVAVVMIIVAVVVAAITYGPVGALVVGSSIFAGALLGGDVAGEDGGLLAEELSEIREELKNRIEASIPERAHFYAKHAADVASKCDALQDKDQHAACLEAALLLCANAY